MMSGEIREIAEWGSNEGLNPDLLQACKYSTT